MKKITYILVCLVFPLLLSAQVTNYVTVTNEVFLISTNPVPVVITSTSSFSDWVDDEGCFIQGIWDGLYLGGFYVMISAIMAVISPRPPHFPND